MIVVDHQELQRFTADTLLAHGTPWDIAGVVSELLVEANLVGHDSHGVVNTKKYVDEVGKGHIVPDARVELISETSATIVADGHWGFGFSVTSDVLELMEAKARASGACVAIIRRQGHVGRLGAYTSRLAERGCIAMMTADSGAAPKFVAPYGGRERRFGTNPLSIAVPSGDGVVCLDMATSATAVGKLMLAQLHGEMVGDDMLMDAVGTPTRNPDDFFAGGALLPFGGSQAHKGSGLSFMVEVLSGILTGIGYGVDPEGRHNDGCFLLAVDAAALTSPKQFSADVLDFAQWVKGASPAEGFSEVLYPGELEVRTRSIRERTGVPVEDSTYEFLTSGADRGASMLADRELFDPGAVPFPPRSGGSHNEREEKIG